MKTRVRTFAGGVLLSIIALFGISQKAYSQDIIITKDSVIIEATDVIVGSEIVKYRLFAEKNGPIYFMPRSEIWLINQQNVAGKVSTQENAQQPEEEAVDIKKLRKIFNSIGDDDLRMLRFFKEYDTDYYDRFNAACAQRKQGSGLLAAGLGLMGFGAVACIVGVYVANDYVWDTLGNTTSDAFTASDAFVMIGVASAIVGEVLTIVSIPISASAGFKKKIIKQQFEHDYFNYSEKTAKSPQPRLNFGFTQGGGVGLTLNF